MAGKKITRAIYTACIVFLVSCSGNDKKTDTENSSQLNKAFVKNIKTIRAESGNKDEELTLSGKVGYDPDKVINYIPLVSGIADRTYFSLGDKVQKGQALIDIRSSDFSSLQAESVSARSDVKIAQRELQTAQSMFEDNILSEKELLEAQEKLKQAKAVYNRIQHDMGVHGANKGNNSFSIKSPMTGYIVGKNISSGSTVSADGDPLFTVADLSTVWITANVYAGNLQFVKEGMEVSISTLSYPGEVFHGKISSLSQIFDPEEKVLKARIIMDNKDLKFKPEMSVVVKLKNVVYSECVYVPSDALIFDDDRYFVIISEPEDRFKIKEVILQGHNNKTTYIASGLSAGESVVVKNQLLLYSGLKEN